MAVAKAVVVAVFSWLLAAWFGQENTAYIAAPLAASALTAHVHSNKWYFLFFVHVSSMVVSMLGLYSGSMVDEPFLLVLLLLAVIQVIAFHPPAVATGIATFFAGISVGQTPLLVLQLGLLLCVSCIASTPENHGHV